MKHHRLFAPPWAFALCAFFILLFTAAHATALTLPELADKAKPAVVLLTVFDASGRKLGSGTGFFVSKDGFIVTNHHVIKDGAQVTATLSNGIDRPIQGVLATDPDKDIAILQSSGAEVPSLPLGDSTLLRQGEDIVVLGNPMGLAGTLTPGIVSALRERGVDDSESPNDMPSAQAWQIQISAPISPGSSGSPIMTLNGDVVAVAVGMRSDGQNLNFGVRIEVAKALLSRIGQHPIAQPFTQQPTQSLVRNLLISLGVFGVLGLIYLLWSRHETRQGRRPTSVRRNLRS